MLSKRQVLMTVSIVVTSFLIGTTFSFATMAKDRGGNPSDKIWEAIYDVEDRLDSIECVGNTDS